MITKQCGCGCRKTALQPGKVVKKKGRKVTRWTHKSSDPHATLSGVEYHYFDRRQDGNARLG